MSQSLRADQVDSDGGDGGYRSLHEGKAESQSLRADQVDSDEEVKSSYGYPQGYASQSLRADQVDSDYHIHTDAQIRQIVDKKSQSLRADQVDSDGLSLAGEGVQSIRSQSLRADQVDSDEEKAGGEMVHRVRKYVAIPPC